MSTTYALDYLSQLEAESIYIIREAVAEAHRPVMLYSIGKDSSVLLRLAEKAFAPGKIPFPVLHIDTGFKFKEMIEFRNRVATEKDLDLIVYKNEEPAAQAMTAAQAHTEEYIYYKKTKPLLDTLKKYNFDFAFGGARRDEEKSRAKERIFSHRDSAGAWNPRNQRPELWHLYNTTLKPGDSLRVFPLSNWTEQDVWMYIKREQIDIVPLYFAKHYTLLKRRGMYLRVDDYVQPEPGEEVTEAMARYRTLGCSPSTGAVLSEATTFDDIIAEVMAAEVSERGGRAIDKNNDSAMEKKKKEGYF